MQTSQGFSRGRGQGVAFRIAFCGCSSEHGEMCLLPVGHDGQHQNGSSKWFMMPRYSGEQCRGCGSLNTVRAGTAHRCAKCGSRII